MFKYFFKMLGQPSSYAGIAAMAGTVAANVGVATPAGQVATAVAAVAGAVAFLKDSHTPHPR